MYFAYKKYNWCITRIFLFEEGYVGLATFILKGSCPEKLIIILLFKPEENFLWL